MKLNLPKVAEQMIEASNEKNFEKYLACFHENAVIDDVGDIVRGKQAIRESMTQKEYEYHIEPTEVVKKSEDILLKGKVTGTFEGSPLDFEFKMKLEAGLIQELKIDLM